jgi:hypothetical protein
MRRREGINGGLPETAVDMTLRLDNARALPHAHSNNSSDGKSQLDHQENGAAKESN